MNTCSNPSCGYQLKFENNFCTNCGTPHLEVDGKRISKKIDKWKTIEKTKRKIAEILKFALAVIIAGGILVAISAAFGWVIAGVEGVAVAMGILIIFSFVLPYAIGCYFPLAIVKLVLEKRLEGSWFVGWLVGCSVGFFIGAVLGFALEEGNEWGFVGYFVFVIGVVIGGAIGGAIGDIIDNFTKRK